MKYIYIVITIISLLILGVVGGCSSKSKTLDDVVTHFKNQGFEMGGKKELFYAMIGAEYGFWITLDGERIELYKFNFDNPETDEAKKYTKQIKDNNKIIMMGIEVNFTINGDFALNCDDHSKKQKIIEVFREFK